MDSRHEKTGKSSLEPDSALTTCPFCSCGCGLYLHHDSKHTNGTSPSLNHPVAQGHLCARGWAAHEMSAWGPRLLTPLVRRNGTLRETSWSEALDRAHHEIQALVESGRELGVLVSGRSPMEECFLGTRMARGTLKTPNLDDCLRPAYEGLLEGLRLSAGNWLPPASLMEVERSAGILLLEGDLAESHPRVAFAVMKARRRGARLFALGLSGTQMSRLAQTHISLDPSDLTAFAGPLRQALADAPVPGPGGLTVVLTPFAWESAALVAAIVRLAEVAQEAGQRRKIDVRFLPLPLRANTRGAYDMGVAPNHLPGSRPMDDDEARIRIRDAWGTDTCLKVGLSAEEMVGRVDGLLTVRDHPPASLRLPNQAMKALQELKSLVVLDAYRTPTSEAATVCLPIPSLAETRGFLTSMSGRVQGLKPASPSPGTARPGWLVLSDLLARWDHNSRYENLDAVFQEIRSVVPEYRCLSSEDLDRLGGRKISLHLVPGKTPDFTSDFSRRPETRPEHGEGEDPAGEEESSRGTELAAGKQAATWLAVDGGFDWADDSLVMASPTLSRDSAHRRKRFPHGLVTMNPEKAKHLGVRAGWSVRLRSPKGEVEIPVRLSRQVPENLILAPFGFRDALIPVLGESWAQRVEVEPI